MNLFTSNELMYMIIIVSGLLLIILVLTAFDVRDFVKSKKNKKIETVEDDEIEKITDEAIEDDILEEKTVNDDVVELIELNDEVETLDIIEELDPLEDNNEVLIEELDDFIPSKSNSEVSNVIFEEEEIVPVKLSKLVETKDNNTMLSEQEKARLELEKITDELSIEDESSYENTITNFELEQEENAIISLDELAKISDNLYDNNEVVQYDDGNEPISIDEVIRKFNSDMQFENTANYEKLDREIEKNNNEFMKTLKELYDKNGD